MKMIKRHFYQELLLGATKYDHILSVIESRNFGMLPIHLMGSKSRNRM